MKGTGGENDHQSGDAASANASTKAQRRKKKSKTESQSKKPAKQKKKSLRQSWRETNTLRKIEIVLLALTAVGGTGYLIAYISVSIWQTRMQHAPVVIHSLPPAFLQPFICDPETGFHTGNMQLAVKNIGTGRANDVSPYWMFLKIIPEKRRGDPAIDGPPPGDCNMKPKRSESFPLDVGVEMFPQIRQSAGSLPKLNKGESVQLYFTNCIFYWDDQGTQHITCDRYRLNLPSSNPLDSILGSPSFVCDGQPKSGKFMSDLQGHCEN